MPKRILTPQRRRVCVYCCLSILLLKRLFAWYYQRKLNKNSTQLNGLRAEKKKIIEKVMDTETYKVDEP